MEEQLGTTQRVVEFDTLRHSLKMSSKKPTASQKKKHEVLLAQLQQNIQIEKTDIFSQIKKNESEYLNTHHSLPDSKCTDYTKLYLLHGTYTYNDLTICM